MSHVSSPPFQDDDYYTTTTTAEPTTTTEMQPVNLDGFEVIGESDDFERRLAEFDQPKVQIPSPAIDNRIWWRLMIRASKIYREQCKSGYN